MPLEHVKHDNIWLKNHPKFNEAWVVARIAATGRDVTAPCSRSSSRSATTSGWGERHLTGLAGFRDYGSHED